MEGACGQARQGMKFGINLCAVSLLFLRFYPYLALYSQTSQRSVTFYDFAMHCRTWTIPIPLEKILGSQRIVTNALPRPIEISGFS